LGQKKKPLNNDASLSGSHSVFNITESDLTKGETKYKKLFGLPQATRQPDQVYEVAKNLESSIKVIEHYLDNLTKTLKEQDEKIIKTCNSVSKEYFETFKIN
jgi:flagellar hook-associated protein FlgK